MRTLTQDDVHALRSALSSGEDPSTCFARTVGDTQAGAGVWRLFSDAYPAGGVAAWNSTALWRAAWVLPATAFMAFGEDVFGNQLGVAGRLPSMVL